MRNNPWITAAILTAALNLPSSLLLAQQAQSPQPAPAATAPATTRPLQTVADQAAALKAPGVSQSERNEAARRLVAGRSPDAKDAVRAALSDPANRSGQLAVIRALAADADPDAQFVDDLFALANGEPPVSTETIKALTNYRTSDVLKRLLDLARDPKQRDSTRIEAIRGVGTFTDKLAAAGLMQLLTNDAELAAIRNAAAQALIDMTGLRSNGRDLSKWQDWWNASAQKDDAAFESDLLQNGHARFIRWRRRYDSMVEEMGDILADAYQAAPDKQKEGLLIRYLRASTPETREAGVQIVHRDFTENRLPSQIVRAQLRSMIGDSSTDVRIQVVQVLRELNEAAALDALLGQLSQEPDAEVRTALVEALVTIRDPKIVPTITNALADESMDVALAAAKGLAGMGQSVIKKDPVLAKDTASAIQQALDARTNAPGTTQLRAALVEALASLQMPMSRPTFTKLLQPGEPVPVRSAAARGLGELGGPGAADILVALLNDTDESIRTATLDGLKLCADFEHAEAIYAHLKRDVETSDAVRQRAWATLEVLFPKADASQLARWADRFMTEHERRFLILKQLADQLKAQNKLNDLAVIQQNIGQELMYMDSPDEAAKFFELALEHHRQQGAAQMIAELNSQMMDALLRGGQHDRAVNFAAQAIAADPGNQQTMGAKLRNEVDRLKKAREYDNGLKLIAAIRKMNPPLAEVFLSSITTMEGQIKSSRESSNTPTTAPAPVNAGTVPN